MRISDWSSDVCSSDLRQARQAVRRALRERPGVDVVVTGCAAELEAERFRGLGARVVANDAKGLAESYRLEEKNGASPGLDPGRSEEHTSELQSLMRISYAVFCLKQKKNRQKHLKT